LPASGISGADATGFHGGTAIALQMTRGRRAMQRHWTETELVLRSTCMCRSIVYVV